VEELSAPFKHREKDLQIQKHRKNITLGLMSRWYRAHNKEPQLKNPEARNHAARSERATSVLHGSGSVNIGILGNTSSQFLVTTQSLLEWKAEVSFSWQESGLIPAGGEAARPFF
jgi:hypothetical protein